MSTVEGGGEPHVTGEDLAGVVSMAEFARRKEAELLPGDSGVNEMALEQAIGVSPERSTGRLLVAGSMVLAFAAGAAAVVYHQHRR